MRMGMLAMGDLAPATALAGLPGLPALTGDASALQNVSLAEFEDLLAGDFAAQVEGSDVDADPFAQMDAWVAQALAQAIEAEMPLGLMPSLQDGAMAAPWLMQALEVHQAQPAFSDDAIAPQASALPAQVPAQLRGAGLAAVQTGGAIEFAALQAGAPGAADAVQAERVVHQRLAAPVAPQAQEGTAAGTAQLLNPRASQDTALPAGMPAIAPEGLARLSGSQNDLPGAPAASAPRAPTEPQQKLIDALGDRLSVQTAQGMRQAVIRLDPHLNGSVRIELRQDANGIAVHLSATNADVVRQLQAIGESLRQDLSARNGGDVTVQVSASRQGQADADTSGGRERHARDDAEEGPGRGLAAAGGDGAFEFVSRDAARTEKETV
ncbi:flagellar hook-length control protein FliK [Ralstonia sp. R-29]|uniref:flagellar hook-length control protein FliK n=1 Tax=Ralstonia sp. R-29 TaxID=3404059 RepID=UPI003CF21EC9